MKKQIAVTLACALHVGLEAQVAPRDSVKTYQAADVVVTATRSEISEVDAPSPVDIVGPGRIQNVNGTSVADALQAYSGLFVRDHGGGATLKNVTLRGSATEHVLVLVDGNRYTNFQNGQVDFSLLRLDNVERIEVLHGGSSALYGADALGGVINILTKPAESNLGMRATASTGSYGYRRYAAGVQGGVSGMGLAAGYSDERGTDNFPFTLSRPGLPDTSLVRSNADYRNEEAFVNGDIQPDERSSVRVSVQHILAMHGVPGGVAVPT
ncbi:MAG TPA: TonB-dependent receptor plug domain-containing protein, partial [Bacteroidota bacterium]|nr:TonB-dependent receptor plug domain-containing protein [Bacteroidota bacterium]